MDNFKSNINRLMFTCFVTGFVAYGVLHNIAVGSLWFAAILLVLDVVNVFFISSYHAELTDK